jgi:hypothetical protein
MKVCHLIQVVAIIVALYVVGICLVTVRVHSRAYWERCVSGSRPSDLCTVATESVQLCSIHAKGIQEAHE